MRSKGISKRPQEPSRTEVEGVKFMETLVEKMDNLEYVVGLALKC